MLTESVGGSDYKVVMGWGQQRMEANVKVLCQLCGTQLWDRCSLGTQAFHEHACVVV